MPLRRFFHGWIIVALLALSTAPVGCDVVGGDDDNVVAGVDLDELFAPPSQPEIAGIEQDWAARVIASVDAEIVHAESLTVPGWSGNVAVVRHRVGDVRHYGAVIVPRLNENRSRPILVYLHGDDDGIVLDGEIELVMEQATQIRDSFIVVIPSYRSEAVRIGGSTFTSDGPPSPWNYDVDDALALVETTLALFPQADEDRIAAVGFSRGSTVAMLMAIRDPRIDAVVEFFGATDFYGSFVREVTRDALRGRLRNLPALDYLNDTTIQPLKNRRITVAEARAELTRRSPLLFADRLPALQVHHGEKDLTVPVSEAHALIGVMTSMGAVSFESYLYPDGHHHPLTLHGSLDRTASFLLRVLAAESDPPV